MNPADKNTWYALATLHQSNEQDFEKKNRVLWNRWVSCRMDDATRKNVAAKRRYSDQQAEGEFTPLSSAEIAEVVQQLREKGFSDDDIQSVDLINNPRIDRFDFGKCAFSTVVHLNYFCFPLRVNFDEATFEKEFFIYDAYFHDYATFKHCVFEAQAHFASCYFGKYAPFYSCRFDSYSRFDGSIFVDGVDFSGSRISGHIDFGGVTLHSDAHFQGVEFLDRASFYKTHFQRSAFRNAKFSDSADFDFSTFADGTDFFGASFACLGNGPVKLFYRMERDESKLTQPALAASFRSSQFNKNIGFENTVFTASSSFEGCRFNFEPPRFFGAKLHQQMEWREVKWPVAREKVQAGVFIDAYACLKLEMDRLKRHDDELDFFIQELMAKRVLNGWFKGLPITIFSYLADCGRSVIRPLVSLLVLWGVFVPIYAVGQSWIQIKSAMGLSLANTLSIFGFRKDFIPSAILDQMTGPIQVLSGLQTLGGAALIFLLGLSLRNRFRMK
jgi:uncharacterized protein YjbI with pentapeptide repeats